MFVEPFVTLRDFKQFQEWERSSAHVIANQVCTYTLSHTPSPRTTLSKTSKGAQCSTFSCSLGAWCGRDDEIEGQDAQPILPRPPIENAQSPSESSPEQRSRQVSALAANWSSSSLDYKISHERLAGAAYEQPLTTFAAVVNA